MRKRLKTIALMSALLLGASETDSSRPMAREQAPSALDIRIHPFEGGLKPAADILLYDPRLRKTGKDLRGLKIYKEIPSSHYERESLTDDTSGEPGPATITIYVGRPRSGTYQLRVIGRLAGEYDLEITAWDRDGTASRAQFTNVKTAKNAIHQYVITYSSSPGANILVRSVGATGFGG